VTLTRYEWSRLWWVSSGLSGRLVQPCQECGALLKLSTMRLLTMVSALALILTSAAMFQVGSSQPLLVLALACAVTMLGGVLGTRVEAVSGGGSASAPGRPDASIETARR
jgi:hypothetical protein